MPSIPTKTHRAQPKPRHTWPGWRAADLILRDPHRFRRLVLLLITTSIIATDPAALPRLLTTLLQHALLR